MAIDSSNSEPLETIICCLEYMDRARHTHKCPLTRHTNTNLYKHTNSYVPWHRELCLNCGEYLTVCITACVCVCKDVVKSLDRADNGWPYGLMSGSLAHI